jgi:hypothetical protein
MFSDFTHKSIFYDIFDCREEFIIPFYIFTIRVDIYCRKIYDYLYIKVNLMNWCVHKKARKVHLAVVIRKPLFVGKNVSMQKINHKLQFKNK